MAKHIRNDRKGRGTPDRGHGSDADRDTSLKIPQPLVVLQQTTPQSDAQYAEESKSRFDQVSAARLLNYLTIASALVSIAGLFLVYLSFRVSKTASLAAQKQSVTAARELEVSQRPWMKAEIEVHNPVVFDDRGLHTSITVRGINVGHSPAIGTFVNYRFVIRSSITNPLEEQKALCHDNPDPFGIGDVVFPSDSLESTQTRIISASDLTSILKSQPVPSDPILTSNGHVVAERAFQPYIIGCLQYETDFSRAIHQTMFLYESDLLVRPGMRGPYTATFTKPFGFGNTAY